MTEIKFYKSPRKAIMLLILTIPFVATGIWMIAESPDQSAQRYIGWFGTLFFGLGIALSLFHLLDRRPQIVINEKGIWDRSTGQEEIMWEQIFNAYPIYIAGEKFISLEVDESYSFRKKQYKWASKINGAIGAQKLNLYLGQLKMDEKIVAAFINEMILTDKEGRLALIKKYFGQ